MPFFPCTALISILIKFFVCVWICDVSDLKESHPFIWGQELTGLDSDKVLGALITLFTDALKRSNIPPGGAEIRQDDPDHLYVYFRTAADRTKFHDALGSKKCTCGSLPDDKPHALTALDFDPENYRIVYTEGIIDGMDHRGDSAHLVEVCQTAGYKKFRVVYCDGEVNVYLPKDESRALFYATHERLTREKEEAGISIKTLRTSSAPSFKVVQ